jgi:cytosine/uracil/thiamine/allantoin permease
MIAATKLLGVIFAVTSMLLAALFGFASTLSLNSPDARERRDATISAFWSLVVIGLCAVLLITLCGCMSVKELSCLARDNTSRPCN